MSAIRLGARRRWSVYLVASGVWASGALWLVAHYFWTKAGEYGPETSAAESWALDIHGAFAMAALWVAGLLWGIHILRGWRARRGRWSGALLLAAIAILVATGYLLYYLGDETWRPRASLVHWAIGLAALPAFLAHRFLRKAMTATGRPRSTRGGR